jgi:arsenate reductase
MKIYHNPRCRKSRETLKIISETGREVQIIEYLKDTPTENELKEIIELLAITPKQLLRKNEAIYKEKFKGKDLTDDQWIKAMVEYPKLIERPIVVDGKRAVLGRPPENVKSLI